MKNIHKLFSGAILCFSISSCVTLAGRSLVSDYNSLLQEREKQHVIRVAGTIDNLVYDQNLYVVTSDMLKQHLQEKDSAMVYLWTPHCNSDSRVTASEFEAYCRRQNYYPVILLDRYDSWTDRYDGNSPLLFLDPLQWDSNKVIRYLDNVNVALCGKTMKEVDYELYFLYHKGRFIQTVKDIKERPQGRD